MRITVIFFPIYLFSVCDSWLSLTRCNKHRGIFLFNSYSDVFSFFFVSNQEAKHCSVSTPPPPQNTQCFQITAHEGVEIDFVLICGFPVFKNIHMQNMSYFWEVCHPQVTTQGKIDIVKVFFLPFLHLLFFVCFCPLALILPTHSVEHLQ